MKQQTGEVGVFVVNGSQDEDKEMIVEYTREKMEQNIAKVALKKW